MEKPEYGPKIQSGVISAIGTSSSQAGVADSEAVKDEGDHESFLYLGKVDELDDLLDRQDNGKDVDENGMYELNLTRRANKTKARSRCWMFQQLCLPMWHKKDRMW